MPRIRTYENKQNIDPSILTYAAQGAVRAGQVKGDAINQTFGAVKKGLDVVHDHMATSETTKLAADMAKAQSELKEQWRQTIANGDPNDPDLAEKFQNDVVKPRLDTLGDGLFTMESQNMFEKASAQMFGDFYVTTAADQAELSATAAAQNVVSMTNDLSMSVRDDPVGWENSVALANAAIDGMVQIPMEARLKMKTAVGASVAESAILGMAKENPQAAIDAINAGEFKAYVPADKADQYIRQANALKDAVETNERQAKADAEKEQKRISEAVETDVTRRFVNGEGVAGWQNDPNLKGDQIRTITNFMSSPDAKRSDPTTWATTYQRILDNEPVTEKEIRQLAIDGKLSKQDSVDFVKLVTDKAGGTSEPVSSAWRDLNSAAKSIIGKQDAMGFMDPDGQQRYLDWSLDTQKIRQQKLEEGIRPSELTDPASPNFILKLNPFTNRSSADRLQAGTEASKTLAEQLKARREETRTGKPADPNAPREVLPATGGAAVSFSLRKMDGESPSQFITRRTGEGDVDMTQYQREQAPWTELNMDRFVYGKLRDYGLGYDQIKAMTPEERNRALKGE